MSINKKEYIHLLTTCSVLNFLKYDRDLIDTFDGLRSLYKEYCKKAAYHHYYPKVDIKKDIAPYLIEVIKYCKEWNIECKYEQINKHTHEHGEYCKFFYNNVDITDLIDLYPGMKEFKYS